MKTIETIDNQPFRHLITTIGALPTSFIDSMSYYEMLAWLCNYLQTTVIPAVDNNAEAVKELQDAYVELKEYVDDYFDNLDVQEEINNKLDEMAESGELATIIAQIIDLGCVFGYQTVAAMAAAENLSEGSIAKVLGATNAMTGDGSFYRIREILNTDVVDGYNIVAIAASDDLVAERIPEPVEPGMAEGIGYKRLGRKIDSWPGAFKAGGYCGMQGGVMSGENTFSYIQLHFDSTGSTDSETSKLVKINLETGEVLASAEAVVEHGNSMAYDRTTEHYFVAPGHSNLSSLSGGYKIIELDKDFNLLSSTATTKNYDSVSVDENGNLYAGFSYKASPYKYHVYKLNKSTLEEEEEIVLQSKQLKGTGQGISVNKGRIVVVSAFPNFIEIFDMRGNNIKNYSVNDMYYKIGESQSISTWDGENYVLSSQFKYDTSAYFIDQFFALNLETNQVEDDIIYLNNVDYKQIFVDGSSTAWNPTGTSTSSFKVIDEVSGMVLPKGCLLKLNTAGTYYMKALSVSPLEIQAVATGTIIRTPDNASLPTFIGSSVFINAGSNRKISLYGAYAQENTNLYLTYVNLVKQDNVNYLVASAGNSVVTIDNCVFDATQTYTSAYFVTDRGLIRYNNNNTDIVDKGTTRFFKGDFEFMKPIKLISADVSAGGSFQLNGGYYDEFKNIKLIMTDNNQLDYNPKYGNSQNSCFCNLSAAGTGNNSIYNAVITKSSSNINFTRANRIYFNASGVMTVDTSPTFKILDIYGM